MDISFQFIGMQMQKDKDEDKSNTKLKDAKIMGSCALHVD